MSDELPAPTAIPVISPSGETRIATPREAQALIGLGWQQDTPEVRAQMEAQNKAGLFSEDAKAFGAATARSATFGLSDIAAVKTGLATPERLSELRDYHPGATLAGEFTGVLAPLGAEALAAKATGAIATGAATAARVASAPVAAVTRAGELVEGGVHALIANETAAKIVGMGARTAAEALAYNAGHNISESALGDYDLTAEKLLAHSGEAALFGGGLGLGMGAASVAASALFAKAKAAGQGAAQMASDAYAAGVAKTAGADAGAEVGQLLDKPLQPGTAEASARKAKVDNFISADAQDQLHRQVSEQLTDLTEAVDQAKRMVSAKRAEETAKLAQSIEPAAAAQALDGWVGRVRETAREIIEDPVMHSEVYGRDLLKIADHVENKIGLGQSNITSAEQVFRLADDVKRTPLADLAEFKRDLTNADRAVKNSVGKVRGLYDELAAHLENPELYGEAAARQQGINEAYTALIKAEDNDFARYFTKPGADGYGREIDVNKLLGVMRKLDTGREKNALDALTGYQQAASRFIDEAEKTATATGEKFDAAGMRSLIEKSQKSIATASDAMSEQNKIRAQDMFGMAMKGFMKDIGQLPLVGAPVAAAANIVGAAASPYRVARMLSSIEGAALFADKAIDSAIAKFAKLPAESIGAKAGSLRDYQSPMQRQRVGDDNKKAPDVRATAALRAIDHVNQVAADPLRAHDVLATKFAQLDDAAPNTKASLIATQLRVAGFLAEKAPKNPFAQYPGMQWSPSEIELAKFERYVEAASNPLAVIDQMTSGYVTVEAAEAVKACYPKLFADIQGRFAARAVELRSSMTYKQRMALSRVFGVAIDPTAEPAFGAWMQSQFGAAEKPATHGGGGGVSKIPSQLSTPAEKRAQN